MSEKSLSGSKSSQKLDLLKQRSFVQTDEHALEFVANVNGIVYINDSKAIRITETLESLERMESSVVLSIGGDDDKTDYAVVKVKMIEPSDDYTMIDFSNRKTNQPIGDEKFIVK